MESFFNEESLSSQCLSSFNVNNLRDELLNATKAVLTFTMDMLDLAKATAEIIKVNSALLQRDLLKPPKKQLPADSKCNKKVRRKFRDYMDHFSDTCTFTFDLSAEMRLLGEKHVALCRLIKKAIKRIQIDRARYSDKYVDMVLVNPYDDFIQEYKCALERIKMITAIDAGTAIPCKVFDSLLMSLEGTHTFLVIFLDTYHLLSKSRKSKRSGFFVSETFKLNPTMTSVMNMNFTTLTIICGLLKLAKIPLVLDEDTKKNLNLLNTESNDEAKEDWLQERNRF